MRQRGKWLSLWEQKDRAGGRRRLRPWGRRRAGWPDPLLAGALAALARRVRARYWLETLRLALLWGSAAAAALLVLLRLTPWAVPEKLAAAGGALAVGFIFGLRWWLRPDALAVVHTADAAGLAGRAITAFRLLQKGRTRDAWEQEALNTGLAACRSFPAVTYPLLSPGRSWRHAVLLVALYLVLAVTPNPLAAYWEARREEGKALAAAAARAKEVLEPLAQLQVKGKPLLDEDTRRVLAALPRELMGAGGRREAAIRLSKARQHLVQVFGERNPATPEEAARLASLWREANPPLSKALQQGEAAPAAAAMQAWLEKAAQAAPATRREAALQLFRSAESVRDPALRQALREAARALYEGSGLGHGGTGGAGLFSRSQVQALAQAVASVAAEARAAAALALATDTLNELAVSLGGGAGPAVLARAGGAVGGAGRAGRENAADPAATGGDGPGSGTHGGGGGSASGAGTGNGSGRAGGDSGTGGSGEGSGNIGDSRGGGTGPGGAGSGGRGAGTSGGGPTAGTPHLLGGEGPQSRVSGEIRPGAAGAPVGLPWSPAAPGSVPSGGASAPRYGQEAPPTAGRTPLPPALEHLVWQYFSSLEDTAPEK